MLVGCSNNFSNKEVKDIQEKEQVIIEINDDLRSVLFDVSDIICNVFEGDDEYTIEDVENNKELLKKYEEQLNDFDVDKVKKYHEYRVENENTTKIKEDELFSTFESRYNLAVRRLRYCEELLSYFDDREISKDEYWKRAKVYFLAIYPIQNDKVEKNDVELVELQKELDKKYNTVSEGADEHKDMFE